MQDITFPDIIPPIVQEIPQDDLELLSLIVESDWSEEQRAIRPLCATHEWAPTDILGVGVDRVAFRCCLGCSLVQAVCIDALRAAIKLANDREPAA